ncbi:hypothetical protein QM042_01680 [Escherichia coli]|uniref:hypothetical protein n=1 Tax=Escherichia coli TaxID=562 RepID=UPI003986BEE1
MRIPETTISEMLSANNSKSGSVDLVLQRAGGTHFIADAVALKSANGVWDDSGTILKIVSLPDVEDVGFQIYNGNATTTPILTSVCWKSLNRSAVIQEQYIFPITAKQIRSAIEALQPGEVQGQAIFAVSYD